MITQLRAIAVKLAGIEIWLVALFIAAGIVSEQLLLPALAVAGAFWLIRRLAHGYFTLRTPPDGAIALLGLMAALSLWITALPDITYPHIYRLLAGVALYYAVVNWAVSQARLRLLVTGTIVTGLLLALVALFSVEWPVGNKLLFIPLSLYNRISPLFADTINPNIMAGVLVVLLPGALALLLFGWQKLGWFQRLFTVFSALGMTSVVILTQSRGALMALVVALIGLAVLRWRHGWLLLPVLGIIVGITIWSLGAATIVDILTANDAFGGFDKRLEIWSRALYIIQDFPFTGIGMGLFQPVVGILYPLFLAPPDAPHAHNLFLQIAVDLGIPGLIAWLAILMLVVFIAWRIYWQGRSKRNGLAASLGAGLLCSQAAMVAHGVIDAAVWGGVRPAVFVWLLWGLTIAGWRVYGREDGKNDRLA